jgi:hypothetical protein
MDSIAGPGGSALPANFLAYARGVEDDRIADMEPKSPQLKGCA